MHYKTSEGRTTLREEMGELWKESNLHFLYIRYGSLGSSATINTSLQSRHSYSVSDTERNFLRFPIGNEISSSPPGPDPF